MGLKLSELILELAGELHRQGDLEVQFTDDEGWPHEIKGVRPLRTEAGPVISVTSEVV